jgi:hypothetical protein
MQHCGWIFIQLSWKSGRDGEAEGGCERVRRPAVQSWLRGCAGGGDDEVVGVLVLGVVILGIAMLRVFRVGVV